MPDGQYVLALDQGTTSSRAILFDKTGAVRGSAQQEFPQIYPAPGEVEHDPDSIWESQSNVAIKAVRSAGVDPAEIASIGITNQRETVVLWERESGDAVGHAIVWQSRVSAPVCQRLRRDGCFDRIREKTGLVIDPYFSGTKLTTLLERDPELKRRAERGEILFGTVDSFLLYRLTKGAVHATDVSNASRTLLFNIHTLEWDDELLEMMGVPRSMLPEVRPSSHHFGETNLLGPSIPITGIAGDQQAATFGQTCFSAGEAKNTYGTGAFLLMNIGQEPKPAAEGLLTTIGWQLREGGPVTYCFEGAVFIAGAVVQWLRDGLGVIASSTESEEIARSVSDTGGVYFVPAFVGLGAPWWDENARGCLVGLTRGSGRAEIVRAGLESMAFQSRDLIELMEQSCATRLSTLRVDGGATANNLLMQIQADVLGRTVERPVIQETTALGAAYLSGLHVGIWSDVEELRSHWNLDQNFTPQVDEADRESRYHQWKRAVDRSRGWVESEP